MLQHNIKKRKSNATSLTSQLGLECISWWEVPDPYICRCSQCRTFKDRIYRQTPPIAKAIHDLQSVDRALNKCGLCLKTQAFFIVSKTQDSGHRFVFTDVSDCTPIPARPNRAKASSVRNTYASFLGYFRGNKRRSLLNPRVMSFSSGL